MRGVPRTGRVAWPVLTLVLSVLLGAALTASGCAKRGAAPQSGAGIGQASGAATAAGPITASSSPDAQAVLPDGRHPVYLTRLDVPRRQLTFDLVQFLTGVQAKQAWLKDHPDEPDGPPNDYYIVNDNPKLRTLPIAGTVQVKVVDLTGPGGLSMVPIALADLPGHLSRDPNPGAGRLWPAPFWLTVEHGQIVAMEEQYIP